ncbi:MAG: hypothetical protein Tsb005_08430 [Gammaproteobacteria bacterium]
MPTFDLANLTNNDLLDISNFENHHPRYFAMLHLAVMLEGDTTLEGGDTKEAINYYRYYSSTLSC